MLKCMTLSSRSSSVAIPQRPFPKLIIGRAVGAGTLAGGVSGLVIGTAILPIVGTGVGTAVGAMAGAGLGLVNGFLLVLTATRTDRRGIFAAVTGVVCGGVGLIGVSLAAGGWSRILIAGWPAPAFLAWCIVLGAALGPVVVRPRESSGRRHGPDVRATRIVRFAAYGAAGAATVGAIAGLAVGLVAYAPTAPFALVEGAFLAGPPGALIGALIGALVRSVAPPGRAFRRTGRR